MISLVIHFRIWLRKTERLVSVCAFSGFGKVVGVKKAMLKFCMLQLKVI